MTIGPLAWFAMGIVGDALVWASFVPLMQPSRYREWCPTPRAIFGVVLCSVAGPFSLLMGITMMLCTFLDGDSFSGSWWARPICRRKEQ